MKTKLKHAIIPLRGPSVSDFLRLRRAFLDSFSTTPTPKLSFCALRRSLATACFSKLRKEIRVLSRTHFAPNGIILRPSPNHMRRRSSRAGDARKLGIANERRSGEVCVVCVGGCVGFSSPFFTQFAMFQGARKPIKMGLKLTF